MTHILKLFPYSEKVGGVIVPLSQDNTLFRYLQLKMLMHYVLKTCIKIS